LLQGCKTASMFWENWASRTHIIGTGASTMKSVRRGFSYACCVGLSGFAAFILSMTPSWAGLPVPAPMIGVTGPVGLVAAGAACGGYLLFKRLNHRG
jgi:hypothetical protein